LTPADLTQDDVRTVFEVMIGMADAGRLDGAAHVLGLVADELALGVMTDGQAFEVLSRAQRESVTVANVPTLADRIVNDAARRQVKRAALEVTERADDPAVSVAELVEYAAARVAGAGGRIVRTDRLAAGKLGALTGPALDHMRNRRDGLEKPVPLPHGWTNTRDELHGGLWPGLWLLVGGTGAGKSQWAFELAYSAAVNDGVPVAYAGLELDAAGLVARLAALGLRKPPHGHSAVKVPWSALYVGKSEPLAQLGTPAGRAVLAVMDAAPLYMVTGEARGWDYREIEALAVELRRKHPEGPALLVVDFLQLVSSPPGAREDAKERNGNAAYAARMAARKHGITVLLVSATARSFYPLFAGANAKAGGDDRPLGDGDPARLTGTGKEAGDIEYACDGVLALCREPDRGASWLAVAKARMGPGTTGAGAGWVRYDFDGTAFTEPPARGSGSTVPG